MSLFICSEDSLLVFVGYLLVVPSILYNWNNTIHIQRDDERGKTMIRRNQRAKAVFLVLLFI